MNKVTKAEAVMSGLLAELNLPIAAADTFTRAVKVMFPDSSIARKFHCGRSKATALIIEMAGYTRNSLAERMRARPFTLSTDGSDNGGSKQFPLVVRTVVPTTLEVRSDVLSVPVCRESATGDAIFKLIDEEFTKYRVPWENCLALGCDNAYVMTGKEKGVFAFCKKRHNNIALAGCTLHLVHISAEKGADSLPMSASAILVDVFFFFKNNSSLRQHRFNEFQAELEVDQQKMLKHVSTRWLSIGRCLERLLKNWDPLKAFFKAEETAPGKTAVEQKNRVGRIVTFLKSPTNRLYCIFLLYTIGVFDEVLLSFQSDAPKVHCLRRSLHNLLLKIMMRFVKPTAIKQHGHTEMDAVQYKLAYDQKMNADLMIGAEARKFISERESNGLRQVRIDEFFSSVRTYFVAVCDYLIAKLPCKMRY